MDSSESVKELYCVRKQQLKIKKTSSFTSQVFNEKFITGPEQNAIGLKGWGYDSICDAATNNDLLCSTINDYKGNSTHWINCDDNDLKTNITNG